MFLERPTLLNAQDTFQLPVHINILCCKTPTSRMYLKNVPPKNESVSFKDWKLF